MTLEIKLIDTTLPLPKYETAGSVAFDIYARTDVELPPAEVVIIPTNLIIKVPQGYFLMLAARSSSPVKKGFTLANGIGVIDQDYHGKTDEIGISVLNFTKKMAYIKRGERIAQGLLVQIATVTKFQEMKHMKKESRGGFGSTK